LKRKKKQQSKEENISEKIFWKLGYEKSQKL
jgi:hypothetical protein